MRRFTSKRIAMLVVGAYLGLSAHKARSQTTRVTIDIPETVVQVDPMIYGKMLENVNDSMIYGGVVDLAGNVRNHLIQHHKDLQIPVMLWPGGTVVYG